MQAPEEPSCGGAGGGSNAGGGGTPTQGPARSADKVSSAAGAWVRGGSEEGELILIPAHPGKNQAPTPQAGLPVPLWQLQDGRLLLPSSVGGGQQRKLPSPPASRQLCAHWLLEPVPSGAAGFSEGGVKAGALGQTEGHQDVPFVLETPPSLRRNAEDAKLRNAADREAMAGIGLVARSTPDTDAGWLGSVDGPPPASLLSPSSATAAVGSQEGAQLPSRGRMLIYTLSGGLEADASGSPLTVSSFAGAWVCGGSEEGELITIPPDPAQNQAASPQAGLPVQLQDYSLLLGEGILEGSCVTPMGNIRAEALQVSPTAGTISPFGSEPGQVPGVRWWEWTRFRHIDVVFDRNGTEGAGPETVLGICTQRSSANTEGGSPYFGESAHLYGGMELFENTYMVMQPDGSLRHIYDVVKERMAVWSV